LQVCGLFVHLCCDQYNHISKENEKNDVAFAKKCFKIIRPHAEIIDRSCEQCKECIKKTTKEIDRLFSFQLENSLKELNTNITEMPERAKFFSKDMIRVDRAFYMVENRSCEYGSSEFKGWIDQGQMMRAQIQNDVKDFYVKMLPRLKSLYKKC